MFTFCRKLRSGANEEEDLSDDDDPNVEYDREIERRIRQVATKNNINELAVRHILRVCKNVTISCLNHSTD